jgi:excisionase family DNA binding protein
MDFITTKDLCQYLKVTKTTIERWRDKGLPFTRVGRGIRFKLDEVMLWLDDQK